jgi:hypothetical protein
MQITGEAFVGISFVRNAISVGLLFGLAPWIEKVGLRNVGITISLLCLGFYLLTIPMVLLGKRARRMTAKRYAKMAELSKLSSRG